MCACLSGPQPQARARAPPACEKNNELCAAGREKPHWTPLTFMCWHRGTFSKPIFSSAPPAPPSAFQQDRCTPLPPYLILENTGVSAGRLQNPVAKELRYQNP